MPPPDVCVVVPTRNRPSLLGRLLGAIALQQVDAEVEVVVVDDGSDPAVALDPAPAGPVVRVVRTAGHDGPAAARNVGWRSTVAPLVVFTDDDVVPDEGWLAEIVAAHRRGARLVQGATVVDQTALAGGGPWAHWTAAAAHDQRTPTCNVAYERSLLDHLGGFDEHAFGPVRSLGGEGRCMWGEDTDLAWRAHAEGVAVTPCAAAVVRHDVVPGTPLGQARDSARLEGLVVLAARHGRARVTAVTGPVVRPTDVPALLVALVALSLCRGGRPGPLRLGAAVVATAWYAWACRRSRPAPPTRTGWLLVVPVAWLIDLHAVAVLARASWRHRVLVL